MFFHLVELAGCFVFNNTLAQSNQTMAEAAKLQAEKTSKALNNAIQLNAPGPVGA